MVDSDPKSIIAPLYASQPQNSVHLPLWSPLHGKGIVLRHKKPMCVRTGTAENENVGSSMVERGGDGRPYPNRSQLACGSSGECHLPCAWTEPWWRTRAVQSLQSKNHRARASQTMNESSIAELDPSGDPIG